MSRSRVTLGPGPIQTAYRGRVRERCRATGSSRRCRGPASRALRVAMTVSGRSGGAARLGHDRRGRRRRGRPVTPAATASGPRLLAASRRCALAARAPRCPRRSPAPRSRRRARTDRLGRPRRASRPRRRGFPTALKLAAVAESGGRPIVVANGAEGEPASAKDRRLLEWSPHLVLDGALLAAQALGARRGPRCASARAESAPARALRRRSPSARRPACSPVPIRLVATPSSYLAGEESALVRFLNGGPPKPTFVPPRPFERGVARRPTLVQNVETLSHLALIARHGPEWFREAGTPREPGTALVTLSGAVAEPGVYEIGFGTSLRDLLGAAGGATAPVRAVLLGGYFGSWLDVGVARDVILARGAPAPARRRAWLGRDRRPAGRRLRRCGERARARLPDRRGRGPVRAMHARAGRARRRRHADGARPGRTGESRTTWRAGPRSCRRAAPAITPTARSVSRSARSRSSPRSSPSIASAGPAPTAAGPAVLPIPTPAGNGRPR